MTQPREHAVPCSECRRMTWNVSARCDTCTTVRAIRERDNTRSDAYYEPRDNGLWKAESDDGDPFGMCFPSDGAA